MLVAISMVLQLGLLQVVGRLAILLVILQLLLVEASQKSKLLMQLTIR
nr:MAG TPA: hypothetical protein [Caudoviricetes sp.]